MLCTVIVTVLPSEEEKSVMWHQPNFNEKFRFYLKITFFEKLVKKWGHAVVQLVEALRYKLEGHGFDA
jgi:hypothetical protein